MYEDLKLPAPSTKRDEHYDLEDSHSNSKIGLMNELIDEISAQEVRA